MATFTGIDVYPDYTKPILGPATIRITDASHYHADYILMHFAELMQREINTNPDIVFNSDFQTLINWLQTYKRILTEARQDPNGKATGPDGITRVQYSCPGTHNYNNPPSSSVSVDYYLPLSIANRELIPKIYKHPPWDSATLSSWTDDVNRNAYFGSCSTELKDEFFRFIVTGFQSAYEQFLLSKTIPSKQLFKNKLNQMHNDLQRYTSITSDVIKNGDYSVRYSTVEELLKFSVNFMQNLSDAVNTEINIINIGTDITNYFEKLHFDESDIDGALVIAPDPENDLVDQSKLNTQLQSIIQSYNTLSSSNVFASGYGIQSGSDNIVNAAQMASNLIKSMMQTKNLSPQMNKMLNSTIYMDKNKKQLAEYLDPKKLSLMRTDEKNSQDDFLRYIDSELQQQAPDPSYIAHNRQASYQVNYKYSARTMGGSRDKKSYKYQFSRHTHTSKTISQTGGTDIDLNNLDKANKQSIDTVKKINERVDSIKKLFDKQDEAYFNNINFVDPDGLEQRNEYLIEMMNILIVHRFMMNNQSTDYTKFKEDMDKKISDFHTVLVNMWGIMNSRIAPTSGTFQNIHPAINTLLSQGSITAREIQTIIRENDLITSTSGNAMIKSIPLVELISSITNTINIDSASFIAQKLKNIMSINASTFKQKDNAVSDIYNNMSKFYSDLKTVNAAMNAAYTNIDIKSSDFNTIAKYAGDIIGRNIETANTCIKEMIITVENFGMYVDILQLTRTEIKQTKLRLNDFHIYIKKILNEMSNFENLITARTVLPPSKNHKFDIDKFYTNYITNYVTKLSSASSNIIKYFSYKKDIAYIQDKLDVLKDKCDDIYLMMKLTNIPTYTYMADIYNSSPVNVSTDYSRLANTIINFISKLHLTPFFISKLMKRLNIGNAIKQLVNRFSYMNMIYIRDILNNNEISIKFKKKIILDIAENIITYATNYLRYSKKPNNNFNTDSKKATDVIIEIKNSINQYITNKMSDETFEKLKTNILKIKSITDIDAEFLKDTASYTVEYLINLTKLRGLDDTVNSSREIIRNDIMNQINNMIISIFNVVDDELVSFYNLLNNLSLTNSQKNNSFNDIKNDQINVYKLKFQTKKFEHKKYIKFLKDDLNIYPLLSVISNYSSLQTGNYFYGRYEFSLNEMDDINNLKLFDLTFAKSYLPNKYNLYNDFWNNTYPVLILMKEMIDSQEQIIANSQIKIDEYDLIINRSELFPFVMGMSTNGLNDTMFSPNPPINSTYINITDGVKNNHIFNSINSVHNFSAIIPLFSKTIIRIQPGFLNFNYTTVFYYMNIEITPDSYQIPSFDISSRSNLTMDQLNFAIKLINTGKYIINILNKLYENIQIFIPRYDPENFSTWDKPVRTTDTTYQERLAKKEALLPTAKALAEISTELTNNKSNYFYLDVALLPDDSIIEMLSSLEISNPLSADFNEIIDKSWIFARKLANVWYTLFAHMWSTFILNSSVNFINEIAKLAINNIKSVPNDYHTDKINKHNDYNNYIDKGLNTYSKTITSELTQTISNLKLSQDKFPVETGITNDNKDIIKFNYYHKNANDLITTEIYTIMALMPNDIDPVVKQSFDDINVQSTDLYYLIQLSDKLLDKQFINSLKNIPVTGYAKYDIRENIKDLINDLNLHVDRRLRNEFMLNRLDNLYTSINNDLMLLANEIITYILQYDISLKSDPAYSNPENLYDKYLLKDTFTNALFSNVVDGDDLKKSLLSILMISVSTKSQIYTIFIQRFLTIIYQVIFAELYDKLDIIRLNISKSINNIELKFLNKITTDYYISFYKKHAIHLINPVYDFTIRTRQSDANKDNIKVLLFDASAHNNQLVSEMNNMVSSITSNVNLQLNDFYENELANHEKLITLNTTIIKSISDTKVKIQERNQLLNQIINLISQVMFLPNFKEFAIVDNDKMLKYAEEVINNYEAIQSMIHQKIYSIISKNNQNMLTVSQINNYIAYKGVVSTFNGKIYQRISFGLIEFYLDILYNILYCIDSKQYEDMSNVEKFLYEYYYISLKRCQILFTWIRFEYQPKKQEDDHKAMASMTDDDKKLYKNILRRKIATLNIGGDAKTIFLEFNSLRRLLDEYYATVMEKVQLHLRINDFLTTGYNDNIRRKYGSNEDLLLEYLSTSDEYRKRWNGKNLVFTDDKNGNLYVNFDILRKIDQLTNPGGPPKQFDLYYSAVYNKMYPPPPNGIKFQRIYNMMDYPDSDIISSYMAIAPNILNNKGTVIMTYGYSGIGKTVSLFGGNDSYGILQATFEQFSDVDIYLRVFEIYGLGTQYNYYWNPTENNQYECFPDFYQCVIHHVLDTTQDALRISDSIVLMNRNDILSYIMGLKNPVLAPGFTVQDVTEPNLASKNMYFTGGTPPQFINSTYAKISKEQYRSFYKFNIDERREHVGIDITNIFKHNIKQIKGTINNKSSSRSILVYDFQIDIDPKSTPKMYVPFLIYDLPGKEDLTKTYIDKDKEIQDSVIRTRILKDVPGDSDAKERKSTYILNPILTPIFDDNIDKIKQILTMVSHGNSGFNGKHLDLTFENKIVKEIIENTVTNFGFDSNNKNNYIESGNQIQIKYFYPNPVKVTNFNTFIIGSALKPVNTFTDLMNPNNIIEMNDYIPLSTYGGLPGVYEVSGRSNTVSLSKNEILIQIAVVVIAYLIKYKLFDLLTEIIYYCVNDKNPSAANTYIDDPSNGNWTKNKIYAFYEAYYINENIVGLLEYLTTNILGNTNSKIQNQNTINEKINDTINKNYKTCARYRLLLNTKIFEGLKKPINFNYGNKVNTDLLDPTTDPLKNEEIKKFITDNIVDTNPSSPMYGSYIKLGLTAAEAMEKVNNVISFENKGKYDTNKLFRKGTKVCETPNDLANNNKYILNPFHAINTNESIALPEKNYPLLKDFIEPYTQKISFYYIFYVLSNTAVETKAEEQIKLLNNSMPFIELMDRSKKKQCAQ